MKNVFLLLVAATTLYLVGTSFRSTRSVAVAKSAPATKPVKQIPYLDVYSELRLSDIGLHESVFEYAIRGWRKTDTTKSVLTIVDLSQPSTNKRMYVIDLLNKKLLFNTYVAHGENSGDVIPNHFSNKHSSFQSSLGFYQTLKTYMGKHGLSLQLKGLEKGFNDNVQNRNIVLHGAPYACEEHILKTGKLGRSQGCPAVPYADSKGIIQAVKNGTCLFVYSPDAEYLAKSTYLTENQTMATL